MSKLFFVASSCLSILIIIFGIFNNETGFKYTFVRKPAASDCAKQVLVVEVPNSAVCCTESSSWLCYAVLNPVNKTLTEWPSAIFLPMLPFLLNGLAVLLATIIKCSILGLNADYCRDNFRSLLFTLRRGLFYFAIIAFRTVTTISLFHVAVMFIFDRIDFSVYFPIEVAVVASE